MMYILRKLYTTFGLSNCKTKIDSYQFDWQAFEDRVPKENEIITQRASVVEGELPENLTCKNEEIQISNDLCHIC